MDLTAEELDIMARTIYGEARGETFEGMLAVGFTIHNRAQQGGWWGDSIVAVCKHPKQYSCWNPNDANRALCEKVKVRADARFREAMAAAAAVLSGMIPDTTQGSTHYHAITITPSWAKSLTPTVRLGRHQFYR